VSRRDIRNLAASVREHLFGLAKHRGDDLQLVLVRYAVERLLYRLSQSPYSNQFLLKGATLFTLWGGGPYRPSPACPRTWPAPSFAAGPSTSGYPVESSRPRFPRP